MFLVYIPTAAVAQLVKAFASHAEGWVFQSKPHYKCHSRCGMLQNPHCSMAMSAEHRSKLTALHQQW